MHGLARFALSAAGLVTLGAASLWAACLGSAGATSFDASLARNNANGGRAELSGATLQEVREALMHDAGDPTLHELVAFADIGSGENVRDATAGFSHSLALRPVSGYTWTSLAAAKYRVGDTGVAFEKSLVNASMLGPSEPPVQATVANLGLAVWREAAPATRESIERMLASGIQRDPQEFMQIAERRGRLDVACRHFDGSTRQADPKWTQTCKSMEATS